MLVSCMYKMPLYQKIQTKCAKLVEEKNNQMFWKNFVESLYFSNEKRYTYC